jgi:polar amino acid transport system permease protein
MSDMVVATYPFHWDAFFRYLFEPNGMVLNGIRLTIIIAVVSEIAGVALGVLLALARMSRSRILRRLAGVYIWFFRGTPLLVQIAIVYFAGFPFLGLPIFGGYSWGDITIFGTVIPGRILAGIFALSANEGAYMAEIVRSGISGVDAGQLEAARSVGMTRALAMRLIVLPQAARLIVPPLGNQFNMMLKTTSLLSVISVVELYTASSIVQGQTFQPFEVFFAAAIYYLIMTSIWNFIQSRVERRLGRGWGEERPAGRRFSDRLLGRGRTAHGSVSASVSG